MCLIIMTTLINLNDKVIVRVDVFKVAQLAKSMI